MLAKPLKAADGRRVTKTLNTGSRSLRGVRAGWRNSMDEAYTGKHTGHRAVRIRLKVDIAP